ncbi:MAG: NAD-dependent protein deacylase [Coriobacteriales bacterium]|nr:NAD-dependent protein deacylase [Coriobacteriales bacterium]
MAIQNNEVVNPQVLELRELLDHAHSAVFFGGAGVSTESGIPDFRSSNGLYHTQSGVGYAPEEVVSHSFFVAHPQEFWTFYRTRMIFADAQPNACHRKLAELEASGHLAAVVTQNIDGLHQAAGSKRVLELHGSVHRNHCLSCGKSFDLDHVLELCDAHSSQSGKQPKVNIPYCPECGGVIKPDVVLYEEPLDEATIEAAIKVISRADVLVIAGTSLAVWPAAGFIDYFNGDKLVVANMSSTHADARADLVIRDPVGQVFNW